MYDDAYTLQHVLPEDVHNFNYVAGMVPFLFNLIQDVCIKSDFCDFSKMFYEYVICYKYMYINNFNKNRFSFQLQMEPELNAKKTHGIITVRFFYNLLSINLIKRMNHIQIIRLWWYNCWLQALKEIKLFMLPLCQPDKNRQKLMRNLRVWTEKFILQSLRSNSQLKT